MNRTIQMTGKPKVTVSIDGILLVHVPGVGDPEACRHFEMAITRTLAAKPRLVVVDLSQANAVSTVMLGLLLKLRSGAAALGAEVRLARAQPMVRSVLNICKLDLLFGVFPSTEAAVEAGESMAVC